MTTYNLRRQLHRRNNTCYQTMVTQPCEIVRKPIWLRYLALRPHRYSFGEKYNDRRGHSQTVK